MTNLTDLSEQALASLLDLPLDKAREWLKIASSVSEEPLWLQDGFDDLESSVFLKRSSVRKLLELSVEDVARMKTTGEFYRRFPYFKRKVPMDADTRLRHLRELLANEPDFVARFPAAYELLFGASSTGSGLLLPSFGIRVPVRILESAPQESVLPAGWHQDWKKSQDSGDAFSVTFEKTMRGQKEVDQAFSPLNLGYMRGLLLAVLNREEYAERIATDLHNDALREELGAPVQAPVRITDLRLAASPKLVDPKALKEDSDALKKALLPLLKSLELPITSDRVLQWKWNLLWKDEDQRGQESEEEEEKIVRVSFSAAALLLFLDFDMPDIERASHLRLATHLVELATIIRVLSKSLEANARKLKTLLAYRNPHRPPTPGQIYYEALVSYRMGKEPRDVAEALGIKPYKSSPSETGGSDQGGTREWQTRLEERLQRGARAEQHRHPLAASVFKHRDKPRIAAKARRAYRAFDRETELRPIEEYSPWPKVGRSVHINSSTDWGFDVVKAYVQLGSCLTRKLNPFPTHVDFARSQPRS